MELIMLQKGGERVNRRKFLKTLVAGGIGLAGAGSAGGAAFSYFVERTWIETTRTDLRFAALPAAFSGLSIVQFSDVHLGFHFDIRDLSELVERLNRLQPDILVFTGDLVDYGIDLLPKAAPVLARLHAKLGKWAVLGNHDFMVEGARVEAALTAGGFQVFRNGNVRLDKDGGSIYIAGVDDAWNGRPDMVQTMAGIPSDAFSILLAHQPDYVEKSAAYGPNLQLSGHSHGGQVRLPIVGDLSMPKGARKYTSGLYRIPAGTHNRKVQLYVNRGIGTTNLPVRLFCRPEISVLKLYARS